MALGIGSNPAGLSAVQQTQRTAQSLLKNYEKLASGLRINRAGDDAAGLAISEALRADVRQYNQEVGNLQSGVSAAQTADGALESQGEAVQRLRDLAVQASNGTLNADQRAAINEEAQQLIQQIDQTAQNTNYNGTNLIDGSETSVSLGTQGGDALSLNESTASSLGIAGVDLSTQSGAQAAISELDGAIERISENRASLGAQQSAFSSAISIREIASENAAEAESRIRDADVARLVIEQTRNQLLLGAGVGAIRNSGINSEIASTLLGK
ncbi:MAG TPA: flagellin [Candidatus Hydrogenedentes bacterium]|nr:flagellin [Candidatus Hydrogenedentota bacterium]HRK36372.1 flagellin [Candidatus Hydrogenedentota bacterium]